MRRDLSRLSSTRFDLLVIGGGIHGLAVAYDAAQRGLSVALVERGDFGSEASANHLKTVHGGLRYLQSADLPRMRESIVERRTVARLAPHLVTVLPYLIPTRSKLTRSALAMRLAFAVDRAIGVDRDARVPEQLRLPRSSVVSRDECLRRYPGLSPDGVTGGAIWYDYQMRDTSRLTLLFAWAAAQEGAVLANYVEAIEPRRDGARIDGVRALDRLTGDQIDVRATVTLAAAGASGGRFLLAFGARTPLLLLKALNVVTTRPMQGCALGGSLPDGRMLFMVPWRGRMMVGTSQSAQPCQPEALEVTDAELAGFLSEINLAFPAVRLSADEVSLVHRGIVPASRSRSGELTLRPHVEIRDHARDGAFGAMSIIGVKYTTGRGVAEAAVNAVVKKLGRTAGQCRTASQPLPGADLEDAALEARAIVGGGHADLDIECARSLVDSYGTLHRPVVELAAAEPRLAARVGPGVPVIGAQVVHAVREEMAVRLVDVISRRLPLGDAGYPGDPIVDACAAIMAGELGWSPERTREEVAALKSSYAPARLSPSGPTASRMP